MITHSVFFTLNRPAESVEAAEFFAAARQLAHIPGVEHFVCLKQISSKNKFDFGLSMEFASQALYTDYTNHPTHIRFVQQYWEISVSDFMEIDYVSLENER